jgi:hypothetical protein
MRLKVIAVATALMVFAAGAASAATVRFHAKLTGAAEVPPNDTKGVGEASATLDTTTKRFTYRVTYADLTGPATAAHFHGPAAQGSNAPPTVPAASAAPP